MPAHKVHRKQAIAQKTIKSRKFWRWYIRLNKLFIKLEIEGRQKK